MKTHSIAISLFLIFVVALGVTQSHDFFSKPLLIQSLESKTILGDPVYNEITWFEYPDKDVWMMNQSHFGLNPAPEKKDRIVIVIDKMKTPKTAYFMQVKPGPLVWSEDLYAQKTANKVSCFICHSNGLRALRADAGAKTFSPIEWAKVNYMNYKMNSYGLVIEDERHAVEDVDLKVPFRSRSAFDNEVLNLKNCNVCHDGKIRGQLTRQNGFSIDFLVRNKMMPPPEYTLSKQDNKKLKNFLRGL
jgi:hypothetical protein